MTLYDKLVENSLFFVNSLRKMSDELADLSKTSEKNRKEIKEASARNEKNVHEAEAQVEKAKAKYDSICDEYDRTMAVKNGASDPKKPLLSFRSRNEAQLLKMEEDTRTRAQSSDAEYKEKIQLANM
ncbi:putative Rho-GTPase-activating protein 7, partial [Neolecta irregularis DAH-3]